jgi:uncharacterized protein (DUF1800 family)
MAIGSDSKGALIAVNRFAFGARGGAYAGDLARAAADPRGFLKAELLQPEVARLDAPALADSKTALTMVYANQEQKRQDRARAGAAAAQSARATQTPLPTNATTAPAMGDGSQEAPSSSAPSSAASSAPTTAASAMLPSKSLATEPPPQQKLFRADALARFQRVAHAQVGFVERLVHFWSNHFCVSAAKGPIVRASAGSFEREAIRPHVLGRFADMLKAVERHPAMLFYLDNARSFGPNSPAGQRGKRGLNENLAREILELHTLGVHGGYTQADVTSLARIITGWTFAGRAGRIGEPGTFVFFAMAHEPGDHTLLGKVYKEGGMEQGLSALDALARHPSTARHIATKLARHFVADEPPSRLVEQLAKAFVDSEGDLKVLANTLIDAEDAWAPTLSKMRTPEQFLLAAMRAIDRLPDDPAAVLGPLNVMGMPLWQPPGPNGWPDTVAVWASAEGMKLRLDVSAAIAMRMKEIINPSELLQSIAGEAASRETRRAIERAESRQQGLALLLMSPEFQWR